MIAKKYDHLSYFLHLFGILDYKHTERVQFEDDDYYYYVKAVPKIDSEKKKHVAE